MSPHRQSEISEINKIQKGERKHVLEHHPGRPAVCGNYFYFQFRICLFSLLLGRPTRNAGALAPLVEVYVSGAIPVKELPQGFGIEVRATRLVVEHGDHFLKFIECDGAVVVIVEEREHGVAAFVATSADALEEREHDLAAFVAFSADACAQPTM